MNSILILISNSKNTSPLTLLPHFLPLNRPPYLPSNPLPLYLSSIPAPVVISLTPPFSTSLQSLLLHFYPLITTLFPSFFPFASQPPLTNIPSSFHFYFPLYSSYLTPLTPVFPARGYDWLPAPRGTLAAPHWAPPSWILLEGRCQGGKRGEGSVAARGRKKQEREGVAAFGGLREGEGR